MQACQSVYKVNIVCGVANLTELKMKNKINNNRLGFRWRDDGSAEHSVCETALILFSTVSHAPTSSFSSPPLFFLRPNVNLSVLVHLDVSHREPQPPNRSVLKMSQMNSTNHSV